MHFKMFLGLLLLSALCLTTGVESRPQAEQDPEINEVLESNTETEMQEQPLEAIEEVAIPVVGE